MHPAFLLAAATLAAALPASACEMMQYRRVQASEHVHVFEAAEGTTAVVNGNIVAIVGREGVMIVDTGQFPGIARRVIADLEAITKAPVRYVVNTHWHGDHLLANSVFKDAWPGAKVVAHPHTIERAAALYSDYAKRSAERLAPAIEGMRKRREDSRSEDEKLWLDRTLACVDAALKEIPQTTYLPPDTPFTADMKVELGGVTVWVRHIGPGNTPGDLVVWVEQDRLVASGDMVVAPVPYAIGSDLEPWIGTLGALAALQAEILVPGHGPVMRDASYVRDVHALIRSTHEQVTAMKARGVTREEAPALLDTAAFRERHVTTPMRRQAFEQFFVRAAVARAWPAPPASAPASGPPSAPPPAR
jgi:glyoxylase-like metal-dependent hydrolase (beta-lactamase superfamily II)